jgi:AraC-like DNA-binding protein
MAPRAGSSPRQTAPPAESRYREYTPSDTLRPFVDCFWTRDVPSAAPAGPGAPAYRVLPDGCIDVVLTFSEHGDEPSSAMVVGTMTKALVLDPAAAESFVGVRFRPAKAAAFLGLPASDVTDLRVSLDEIWPDAAHVREVLAVPPDAIARVRALERVLTARLSPGAGRSQRDVDEAVRRIVGAGGSLGITRLAPALGVSRQHLARRFSELVGVSPKTFARVVRLGRVLERARAAPPGEPVNWSALAIELGYYDQSHLVDEFRGMTGVTPAAWRIAGGA